MIEFSICIPAYKEEFLKECIQSILQQSLQDFELIILNDCSPASVEEIVATFHDERIRYFKNERNVGAVKLVDNWNKCLGLARGEYLVIMGDDDLLEPDYLEEFSDIISAYPNLDVYHCRSKIINDEGETLMLSPSCPSFENVYDSIWHRLRQYRSNYISDYVYRTQTLTSRGGFYYLPLAWGSDDITAFIASQEKGIAHTNKPVFNYRSNRLSITSTGNDLEKMRANFGYAAWLKDFLSHPPANLEDAIIHKHLMENQEKYMEQRKIYTMTKSMATSLFKKSCFWFSHRKEFGISLKEITIAAIKSINMKNSYGNS